MAAPALLLFNPGTWAALGKAAAYVGSAVVAAVVVNEAVDAVQEATSDTPATDTDATDCANCDAAQPCPACTPPEGTEQGERLDRVPPSRPHHPCPGDHLHTRIMRQNPRTCQCFWNKGRVICLPQGGSAPPGLAP